jgi:tripartite-type tricarboxylate transporter receptor subunit TctC
MVAQWNIDGLRIKSLPAATANSTLPEALPQQGGRSTMQHKTTATRRSLLTLAAGTALFSPHITRAQEANWPNRPVRIIAAFPAGSGTDSLARFYGERLARVFGQNFIIENIGGANGALGARAAARAAPDGYTIFFGSVSTHAANPNLMREPGYDPLRDFAPLSMISLNPLGVLVRADNPARDLQTFIAHARANPGALNYGIGNAGGLAGTHLLSQAAGFKAEQISYRGTPQAMADLLGGRLHFLVTDLGPAVEHLRAGTIRALAVTTARRVETLPDVPTVAESGLPGFDFASWNGSWMPARTPPAIIARLNREMVSIGQSDEAKRHIGALGIVSTTSTPEALGEFNRRELELWARIAAEANVAKE